MNRRNNCLAVLLTVGFLLVLTAYITAPRPVQTLAEENGRTLVIDAGHGGEDGGAVSASGVRESTLNLAVALRVRDLAAFVGLDTVMVRETDVSVADGGATVSERKRSDLAERVRLVQSTPGALLLSIHQNHFAEEKYDGAQVFYRSGSEELAKKTQENLRLCLDPSNRRQAKKSSQVYLMEHISCPAILVECGFLSNAAETEKLTQPDYQKKLAAAMLCAIAAGNEGTEDEQIG